uniref:Ig-like domain-containing protein n=1 Tax=Cyanoderma ruficeps TaxID=181631 RepID=A0A8C3XBD5_9PASS
MGTGATGLVRMTWASIECLWCRHVLPTPRVATLSPSPGNLFPTDVTVGSCDTDMSPGLTRPLGDYPLLQVSARALLEGDSLTLRCRVRQEDWDLSVRFYHNGKHLWRHSGGTELTVQLHHSGHYSCSARPSHVISPWFESAPVTVTVHVLVPTALTGAGAGEFPLNLSCLSTPSPLRPPAPLLHLFYRDGQSVGGPQGSPQLLVPSVGVSHSGNYSCQVRSEGGERAEEQLRGWARGDPTALPPRVPQPSLKPSPGPSSIPAPLPGCPHAPHLSLAFHTLVHPRTLFQVPAPFSGLLSLPRSFKPHFPHPSLSLPHPSLRCLFLFPGPQSLPEVPPWSPSPCTPP